MRKGKITKAFKDKMMAERVKGMRLAVSYLSKELIADKAFPIKKKKCSYCKTFKPITNFKIEHDLTGEYTRMKYGNKCKECQDKDFSRKRIHSLYLSPRTVDIMTTDGAIERIRRLADEYIPKGLVYAIIRVIKNKGCMAWLYSKPLKADKDFKIIG